MPDLPSAPLEQPTRVKEKPQTIQNPILVFAEHPLHEEKEPQEKEDHEDREQEGENTVADFTGAAIVWVLALFLSPILRNIRSRILISGVKQSKKLQIDQKPENHT